MKGFTYKWYRVVIIFFGLFLLMSSRNLYCQSDPYKVYNIQLPDWVKSKNVCAIAKDETGRLWIGTSNDLLCFNSHVFTDYSFLLDSLNSGLRINTIFTGKNSEVYFGTVHGLIEYNQITGRSKIYLHNDENKKSLGNDYIFSHLKDEVGNVWIAHWNGISYFDLETKSFTSFQPYDSIIYRNNVVYDMASDGDTLWLCTWSGGVLGFDRKTGKFFNPFSEKIAQTLGKTQIKSIEIDNKGQLWIGAWGVGVYLYNLNTKEFGLSPLSEKISYNRIPNIEIDKNGDIWVGTEFGLNLITEEGIVYQYHQSNMPGRSLMASYINCIYVDSLGFVWIGSSQGFDAIDINQNSIETYHDWLFNIGYKDHINQAYFVDSTRVYLATAKSGLFLFNPATKSIVKVNTIKDISHIEMDENFLWLGTSNGLFQCTHSGKILHHIIKGEPPLGLTHFQIKAIANDYYGNLWIGSFKGLTRLEKNNLNTNHYFGDEISNDLIHSNIKDIVVDSAFVWVLDLNGIDKISLENYKTIKKYSFDDEFKKYGICRNFIMVDDVLKCFFEKTVVDFNTITEEIVVDSTFLGDDVKNIIYKNPANYWAFKNHTLLKIKEGEATEYSIPKQNIVLGIQQINNQIMLYGNNGFLLFDSAKNIRNKDVSRLILSSMIVHENKKGRVEASQIIKDVFQVNALKLDYYKKNLTFLFTSLDYRQNIRWEYQYFLEGFNNNWMDSQGEQKAVFTNLEPGSYRFYVKARNGNSAWSEPKLLAEFSISPPFWKTVVFKILVFITVIFIMILIFYLRTVQLRRKNIVLKRMVKERTSEIEAQKEELKAQAETLQEANEILKERQEEIETQRDELSTLNATKDKFFSIIAHDLKNPFMGIMGISELLSNNYKVFDKQKTGELINGIYNSSKTAYNLLENLLTWSRSQTKNMQQNPTSVQVKEVVEQCFNLLQLNLSDKKLNKKIDCEDDVFAYADKQMLTTIVRNLLNNAIKFTPEEGEIRISAFYDNDVVNIHVADSGVGMPEHIRQKLFKIDTQVSTVGTSGESGTGLGLIVVKEFIDKNFGTIEVKSAEGKGSVFIIRLPASSEVSIEKPTKQVDDDVKTNKNFPVEIKESDSVELEKLFSKFIFEEVPLVLLVEDNRMIREKIAADLKGKLEIVLAENGKKGLDSALNIIPDVIVTDVNMPEMDGLELCKAIKSDEKTSHIPVIMLTTRDEAEQKLEGLETGANDYITKPFDTRELVLRLLNTLKTRQKLRAKILKNLSFETNKMPVSSLDEKFISKVIAIVETNIENPNFELSVMVKEIGMSQAQLYRKMKALTGQTVLDFVKTLRIKRAAELIKDGKYSVSEAAYATGFINLSHFSKAFKDQIGVPPSQYNS